MESAFNLGSFLDATTSEALTKRPPIDAGTEIVGTIGELKERQWQGKTDPTKSGFAIDFGVEFDLNEYPDLKEKLGMEKVMLFDSIMLDLTLAGAIDFAPGKNSKLRKYREALDMNKPGEKFSIRAMQGKRIKVRVKNEPYNGDIQDKIDSVSKA